MAGHVLPVRSVLPHDGHVHPGPGRDQAALGSRCQQLRDVRGRQGQAVRRVQLRRLRHRRCHPLLPRRGSPQSRRSPVGPQLGALPLRDGWLRRIGRAGRAGCGESAQPQDLPLPGPGPHGAADTGEGQRRSPARDQVLQHGRDHHRGPEGQSAAPRDVRRAGTRAVRSLGRRRRGQGRDRRGRQGVRAPAGWLPRLRDQHARVGVDSVSASGDLHRRSDEGVQELATRERIRGDGVARRELLLRRHRGLLPDAVRPRVRVARQVRPRVHRTGRPRAHDREAEKGHARLERR
jgi:hypothetical protein